ncbi:MAG: ion channel [Halobacteriales archaeon]
MLVGAFYYTIVTAITVSYGNPIPHIQTAKLFGMSVLVVGTASFAVHLGTFSGRPSKSVSRRHWDVCPNHGWKSSRITSSSVSAT